MSDLVMENILKCEGKKLFIKSNEKTFFFFSDKICKNFL